jgi:hypothetical protein
VKIHPPLFSMPSAARGRMAKRRQNYEYGPTRETETLHGFVFARNSRS